MTVPLPVQGSTSWYPWATQVHRTTTAVLHVEDYGAVGDGSTDDTTALANALTAAAAATVTGNGGVVQLASKTYLTGPLTIPHSVTLRGQGRGCTRLLLKASSTAACVSFGLHTSIASVEDLRIDGNKFNQTSSAAHGIRLQAQGTFNSSLDEYNDPRNMVRGVHVENTKGHGILLEGRGANLITNVWTWLCDGNGIKASGNDSYIVNADVGGSGLDGIYVDGADLSFLNCKVWYSGQVSTASGVGNGWHISTFGGFRGSGLGSQDNARAGFFFDNCGRIVANSIMADSNNTANLSAPGVDLNQCYYALINGYSWDRNANTTRQAYALRVAGSSTGNRIDLLSDQNGTGTVDPTSSLPTNDVYVNQWLTPPGTASRYLPVSYGAVGDGTTDDTAALQAALAAMNTAGRGVLDLDGKTYVTGRLSLKSQLGIVNGTLKAKASLNDYLISLDYSAARYNRDWLLSDLVLDGNKTSNTTSPGVVLVSANTGTYDRPLLRRVRIQNAKGIGVNLTSAAPSTAPMIQPRLEHVTIDMSETASGSVGVSIGSGVYDSSLMAVDVGRCHTGVDVESTQKHRFTDTRAWGCSDVGFKLVNSQGITVVNGEADNNLGHGAYVYNSTDVFFVGCGLTNNAYVDVANDFGYGTNYNLAAANTKDGAVLDQNSRVTFVGCRFVNDDTTANARGEQRYGVSASNGAIGTVTYDCTFANNRTAITAGTVTYPSGSTPAAAGLRPGVYNAQRSLYLPTPSALQKLRAKIAQAAVGGTAVNLVCAGDSKTAGTNVGAPASWPRLLRAMLTAAGVTPVGTGLVPAMLRSIDPTLDTRWSSTGTWTTGSSWIQTSTSGATLTFASDVAGTVVDVHYFANSGPFTVTIDGGAPVTVTPAGTNTVGKYTVTGLANTTHSVVLTTTSTTTVYMIGVNVHPTTGLVVHNLGIPGITSTAWASNVFPNAGFAFSGAVPSPDIAIVEVGSNDTPNGISAATNGSNLAAILTMFGNPAALLVCESNTAQATGPQWAAFEAGHYDVADARSVPLLDIADRWGTTANAVALGLLNSGDSVHETAAGHFDIARAVSGVLLR